MVKLNHFWTLTPIDHQIALLMTKFWFFYNYCQFLFITKRTTFVLGSWRNSLPWTQSRWSWRNRFCVSLDRHGQVSLPWTKITRLRHRCCHHQVSPKEIQISRPNKFRIPKIQITQPSHHCIQHPFSFVECLLQAICKRAKEESNLWDQQNLINGKIFRMSRNLFSRSDAVQG